MLTDGALLRKVEPGKVGVCLGNLDKRSIVVDISECPVLQLKVGIESKREVHR